MTNSMDSRYHRIGASDEAFIELKKEGMDLLPCAAYLIKDDPNLTIIYGNPVFYELLGCKAEELRRKYANCLSAFIHADSIWGTDAVREERFGAPIKFRQHIRRNGCDAWIDTQAVRGLYQGEAAFYCISFDATEEQRQFREYEQNKKEIRLIAKQIRCDIFGYDPQAREFLVYNAHEFLMPNMPAGGSEQTRISELFIGGERIHPDYVQTFYASLAAVAQGRDREICELYMKNRSERYVWARMTLAFQKTGLGREIQVVGLLENITDQKEMSIRYLNETQFYQAMLAEKTAFAQVDITMDRCTKFGGMWNLYNEIMNTMTYSQIIDAFINKVVHPEDRRHYLDLMQRENFIQSLDNGIDKLGCEFRRIVEQNKMMWMELRVHLFREPFTHHVLALVYLKNIDNEKKNQLALLHDSERDPLTNIYNKKMAETCIRDQLKSMESNDVCAFLILDIDDFKLINDTNGHKAGDQVLVNIASLLRDTFRRDDIIGRFGGDEFIIFLKQGITVETIQSRLGKLYKQFQRYEEMELSCSIGISLVHQGDSYELIFRQADQALYDAKRAGKGRFVFFNNTAEKIVVPSAAESVRCTGDALIVETPTEEEISFEAFLSEQGEMAYLVNPDNFNLICGNKSFYDRIGMTRAECVGTKCFEVMQRRKTPCPFCSKANWSTDKFYLWRNMNTALEQEFLIKNKLVRWRGKEVLLAIAVDISNNKSIVDSMENGASESHNILSGVQRMAEMDNFTDAIKSALETIGCFFRAGAVRFWEMGNPEGPYCCTGKWEQEEQNGVVDMGESQINVWLQEQKWDRQISIESPEAMLCFSYDMYQYMKKNNIVNQRWVQLRDGNLTLGVIEIDNITSNFQNVAFLESFLVFVGGEIKKRRLSERVIYANEHDELTDLLSRASFEQYMQEFRGDSIPSVGVMVANLDNLKMINSAKGYLTGNFYLKQFSDMLRAVFPGRALFRMNGDEFLAVDIGIDRAQLEAKIQRLKTMVEKNGGFTVSMGYSWDNIEKDLAVLIEQSTEAMRVEKERRHDQAPISNNAVRRKMLSELTAALENREFEVFLQPKVELSHAKVVGAEALIRYRHKELGIITPDKFIGLLERNNLIRYIDLFVFEEICRILEGWKKAGIALPVISLNFSRLTLLERDILISMEQIIGQYDISREYIEIEITESVANMGKSILYQAAQELRNAGFNISLDDFGTKYTNLAILADIDFNMLKLDKSLVGDLVDQDNHQIILKNVIYMCEDLGIDVIAEGVETLGQEEILRKLKCKLGQGYLYGKPMPVQEFHNRYVLSETEPAG